MSEEKRNDGQTRKGPGSDTAQQPGRVPSKLDNTGQPNAAKPTTGVSTDTSNERVKTDSAHAGSAKTGSPGTGSRKTDKPADAVKPSGPAAAGKPQSDTSKRAAAAKTPPDSAKPAAAAKAQPVSGKPTAAGKPQSGNSTPAAASSNPRPAAAGSARPGAGGSADHGRTNKAERSGSGGRGTLIAVVALIVAIAALIGAGWLWYRGEQKLAALDSRVQTVEQGIQSSVQEVVMPRLSKFDQRLQSLSSDLESVQQNSQQQADRLGGMQKSLQDAQSQTAQLADRLEGNAQRWDVNQIEALLRAANQRLQLFEDPAGARQALQFASDAIGRKGDPRLFEIRSEIVNEIAALRALPQPDIEGLALDLAAMVKQVPDLPLASTVPGAYSQSGDASGGEPGGDGQANQQANQQADSAAEQSTDSDGTTLDNVKSKLTQGWGQFQSSVGEALSGMMTIRRSDGTQSALLPPDQVFFLSQNLQLELRAARLALLEGDTDSYRESLGAARQWLDDYYDTGASQVSSMRERLDQISNVKLDWDAPDISQSLSMLRDRMRQDGSSPPESDQTESSPSQPEQAESDQARPASDSNASDSPTDSGGSSESSDTASGSDDNAQQSGDQAGQGGQ